MKKSNRYRRKKISVVVGALILLAFLVSIPVIPWVMGIVTEVQHVYLEDLPREPKGAYAITSQGVLPLYTWHIQMAELPSDAAIIPLDAFEKLAVVQKQFFPESGYMLFNLDTAEKVNWTTVEELPGQLILEPVFPVAGSYLFIVTTDSMYGEYTYHYFALK